MMAIINQIRRLGYDDGRGDKDFSDEEVRLQVAKAELDKAIAEFSRAAQNLYDVLLLERKN